MRAATTQGLQINRAAVEDAMPPPDSLLRDPCFIGSLLVTVSLGGFASATEILFWRVLFAVSAVIAAVIGLWFLARYVRRHRRRTTLLSNGHRHQAVGTRAVTVLWVQRDMTSIYRWAILADWNDALGQPRSSVAGPYNYDPQPLLDGIVATVMADPADPSNAILLPQGLPPLRHAALSAEQRSIAPGARGLSRLAVILLIAAALLLGMLACLLFLPLSGLPDPRTHSASTESDK